MIRDTLAKIEVRLQQPSSLKPEARAELIALVATLKAEIAGFTQVSTHEATREHRDPALLKHSLDGLSASVTRLEESHPRLVAVVNSVCRTLANLGI